MRSTEAYDASRFLVKYFTGAKKSEYSLFDDDRTSTCTIEEKKYQLINFVARENEEYVTISMDTEGWGYQNMPEQRHFTFEMIAVENAPKRVEWGNSELAAVNSKSALVEGSYYYDKVSNTLWVRVAWNYNPRMITVTK